jgi:hypothetical protein
LFVLAAFVGAGAIVNAHFEKLLLAEAFYFAVITRKNKPLACQWYEQWLCQ